MAIFKYSWNFLDQLLPPYKFHGRDMMGIYFFNFASCEPLIKIRKTYREYPVEYHGVRYLIETSMNIYMIL